MIGKHLSIAGLLTFGTATSLVAKIVYELTGKDFDGQDKLFQKPWAMTTVMFIGMTFCLPLSYWQEWKEAQAKKLDIEQPLLGGSSESKPNNGWRDIGLLAIPSFFDLVATVLMNVGLLSVTASVYQMMRGAEMLFAALFAVLFLKRTLNRYHYGGILCCVVGISLVGLSSIWGGEGSATHEVSPQQMLLGMGLIVASQAVQAAQLTFEDFFMADLSMQPLKIVGFEGIYGTAFMVLLLLPIAYFVPGQEGAGLHENTLETLHMIGSSHQLQIVLATDMIALLAYNFCGMMVTGHLGAVFRTVLETMRTLFVWLLGLLLFYTPLGMGKLGESWTQWSFLQAIGFAVLVAGTLVYGKGDEKGAKEELAHAVTEALAAQPTAAADGEPALVTTTSVPVTSRPIAVSYMQTSSLKATRNILSGSYSRSFSRSLPRSALGGGGTFLQTDSPAARQ